MGGPAYMRDQPAKAAGIAQRLIFPRQHFFLSLIGQKSHEADGALLEFHVGEHAHA